jgi:hypothetical protein
MADKNYKMTDILVLHFLMGDHQLDADHPLKNE